MRSRLNLWIGVLASAALSLWLPEWAIIPLVGFVLIQIVIELRRGARRFRRDRFREGLRTAEKMLEEIV